MSLFIPLDDPTHLKMGFYGFAGSGKTRTAFEVATGLHKYIGSKKPIYGIETETGLSYLKDRFEEKKIDCKIQRTRAFVGLMAGLKEVINTGGEIVIIDSATHFWNELMKAYLQKHNLKRMRLRDFVPLKEEWSPFPTLYLNAPLHILMCGRAGTKWGEEDDPEEEGKKKLVNQGTKMKLEGDFGYEPTLLVEMEINNIVGKKPINRSWVVKDKFGDMLGKTFDLPTFESFLPHIKRLKIGNKAPHIDVDASSVDLIQSDVSVVKRLRERDILVEELWGELPLRFNSRTDEGKKAGAAFLKETYGTVSKTAIENFSNERIREGLDKLKGMAYLTEEIKK